LRYNLLSNRQQ